MNQKERLVEVLDNAFVEFIDFANRNPAEKTSTEFIADYLLADGWFRPPVKASDKVFYVHEVCDKNGNEYLDISAGEVVSVSIQAEGLWAYCRYFDGLTEWHKLYDELGKELFTSREDAEKALRGDEGK